ncbi:hypothetical protein PENSPDRAFT_749185 [Peniophora sp. CONT]|nr:hypothetical protein PENSPDRAFT_749185 [Peniophora sp. CONT]
MLIFRLLSLASLSFPYGVVAQDYNIPSGWQDTTSNISRAERLSDAWGAASELRFKVDRDKGYPSDSIRRSTVWNMVIVLANQDRLSGNSSWSEQVMNNTLRIYESGQPFLDARIDNIDIAGFGLAEVAAYLAYNDSSRLAIAQRNFDILYTDFMTVSNAQSSTVPDKGRVNTTCQVTTLPGLLFNIHKNPSDTSILSTSIAPWILLSARLHEITANSTYRDVAELSIEFMQNHMVNLGDTSAGMAVQFDISSCSAITGGESATPDQVGPYIEGLSIMSNLNGTANLTYVNILDNIITAVVSFTDWHRGDGVLTTDPPYPAKGMLLRGLLEARLRNPSNTGLVTLIDDYLTIQFNAIRTNANLGSNEYSTFWHGGGSTGFNTTGNVDALDALTAAFVIAPTNMSQSAGPASPSQSMGPPARPHPHPSIPISTLVGAVLGGIAAICVLALLLWVYLRRQKRLREMPLRDDGSDTMGKVAVTDGDAGELLTEPFLLPAPAHTRLSPPEKGGSQQRVALLRDFINNGVPASGKPLPARPSSAKLRRGSR